MKMPTDNFLSAVALLVLLSTSIPCHGYVNSFFRYHDAKASPSFLLRRTHRQGNVPMASEAPDSGDKTRRDFVYETSVGLPSIAALFGLPTASSAASRDGAGGDGPVAVIGADGRTGRECLRALRSRSVPTRACTRTGTFRGAEEGGGDARGEALWCDVTEASTIGPAVKGARAVIFAASASKEGGGPGAVDNAGLVSVARACIDAGVGKLVIVSSGAVTKPTSPVYLFLNLFGGIMAEKIKGEDIVRRLYADEGVAEKNGKVLSYTIIRPGGLTEDIGRGPSELELNQGDTKSGRIARADVAELCVEAAVNFPDITANVTFECYDADTGAPLASVGISNIFKQKTDSLSFVSGKEKNGNSYKELFTGLERD